MSFAAPRITGSIVLPQCLNAESYTLAVPLDHSNPGRGTIQLFYRLLTKYPGNDESSKPILVFLQGGPGYPAPRPFDRGGWVGKALQTHRVLLFDQRGTGLSTPVTLHGLRRLGSPEEQAEYLSFFRADSIVRDLELLRTIIAPDSGLTVLGQSFGGFCLVTYLSLFPSSVTQGLFTGGLPPLLRSIEDVYRSTCRVTIAKNRQFFYRYPPAAALTNAILRILRKSPPTLPRGGRLTCRRYQMLGLLLGAKTGFETLYYLLESAFTEGTDHLSFEFLVGLENLQDFDTNPIYAILHEAIYMESTRKAEKCSNWAAERVLQEPEFAPYFDVARLSEKSPADTFALEEEPPVYFTGEMVFPFMFDQTDGFPNLKPLEAAAHILATKADWGPLYDPDVLARCNVPTSAVVYYDDMYVVRDFALEAAELLGTKVLITNEYQHGGLRDDGAKLLEKLLDLNQGNYVDHL
eukprot:EG_transcript_6156